MCIRKALICKEVRSQNILRALHDLHVRLFKLLFYSRNNRLLLLETSVLKLFSFSILAHLKQHSRLSISRVFVEVSLQPRYDLTFV